jgi:hypothetical protein
MSTKAGVAHSELDETCMLPLLQLKSELGAWPTHEV